MELDRRAVAALAELEASHPGRLTVVEGDALRMDPAALLPAPRRIVANLPYNVATPLLVGWLRGAAALEGMTLMFQQEVAERICAAPDAEAYGRLSVLAQWRCRCDAAAAPAARCLQPAAEGVVGGGGAGAACRGSGAGPVRRDGAADGGGLRAAPEDAARRAESRSATPRRCSPPPGSPASGGRRR